MLTTATIDIGTTSVKMCLFDPDGSLIASTRCPTPTQADPWGVIYDVEALVTAIRVFLVSIDATQRSQIERIVVTGVGESGGLVRRDLSLASPMILWHDHRGTEYLSQLSPADRTRVYQVTGLPVNAHYGLSKAAWAIHHAGTNSADATWLNVAEYLAALMTGYRWSERSLASRTMALDVMDCTWSSEICSLFGVEVSAFPELRPACDGSPITPAFAADTGLNTAVMVHVAGHDHMVGAVGADLATGELLNSTGTTEGLLFLRSHPTLDEQAERSQLANGIACRGESATLFASIPTGGSAFATVRRMLGMNSAQLATRTDVLHHRYLKGQIDLDRLPLVIPQFRGSPPPSKNSAARGIMTGLRTDTSADDVIMGTFAGMAVQCRQVLDLFGQEPTLVKVIGPASRNPLWLQLKADLLGTPLSVSTFGEVVSRGAQAVACAAISPWERNQPRSIEVDERRRSRLGDWYERIQPRWEFLKGIPT